MYPLLLVKAAVSFSLSTVMLLHIHANHWHSALGPRHRTIWSCLAMRYLAARPRWSRHTGAQQRESRPVYVCITQHFAALPTAPDSSTRLVLSGLGFVGGSTRLVPSHCTQLRTALGSRQHDPAGPVWPSTIGGSTRLVPSIWCLQFCASSAPMQPDFARIRENISEYIGLHLMSRTCTC